MVWLPAAAADLIDTKACECLCGGNHVTYSATFTIDEARALAAALDEAGLEQDELSNAYRLDYEFEYPDERLDPPVHLWFYASPGCGDLTGGDLTCPGSLPWLEYPYDD